MLFFLRAAGVYVCMYVYICESFNVCAYVIPACGFDVSYAFMQFMYLSM
jgi:hypothetical protein